MLLVIGRSDGSISLEHCLVLWRNNCYTCAENPEHR